MSVISQRKKIRKRNENLKRLPLNNFHLELKFPMPNYQPLCLFPMLIWLKIDILPTVKEGTHNP